MKIRNLLEDLASDKSHVSRGNALWLSFLDELKNVAMIVGIDTFENFEKTYLELLQDVSKHNYYATNDGDKIKVNVVISTLALSRRASLTTRTTVVDGVKEYTMNIKLYESPLQEDFDLINFNDFIKTFIERHKSSFIHEVIHYIDHHRADDAERYISRKTRQIDDGGYINTDHEYNAHYLQLVSDIDDMFKSDKYAIRSFHKDPSFENFKNLARSFTKSGSVLLSPESELSGKYRRSLMKRLSQLYRDYVSQITQI